MHLSMHLWASPLLCSPQQGWLITACSFSLLTLCQTLQGVLLNTQSGWQREIYLHLLSFDMLIHRWGDDSIFIQLQSYEQHNSKMNVFALASCKTLPGSIHLCKFTFIFLRLFFFSSACLQQHGNRTPAHINAICCSFGLVCKATVCLVCTSVGAKWKFACSWIRKPTAVDLQIFTRVIFVIIIIINVTVSLTQC